MSVIARLGRRTGDERRARVVAWLRNELRLDDATMTRAEQLAARTGHPVEHVLNQMGVAPDEALARAYAEACGCEVWRPHDEPPIAHDPNLVQPAYLNSHRLLLLEVTDDRLTVAACDPLDDEALAGLAFAAGRGLHIKAASPSDFRRAADLLASPATELGAHGRDGLEAEAQRVFDASAESEAARLLTQVLEVAVAKRSSDVHFEPRRHDFLTRMRVDGRLVDHAVTAVGLAAAVISRIKVLANLDIGERRLPQDGRATFVVQGRSVEARVSIVPTVFGESAVLRILDRVGVSFDLAELGLSPPQAQVLERARTAAHGLFLIAGPTGSGKTTTLYALLNAFAGSPRKVLSVEDPVEHHFDHVRQVQVAPQIGLTFANALRAFLRHDPDVILVGEIRDPETAAVAVRAAMTGHLVLASVHANDAVRAAPRLLDMGVEPYQLAACLVGAAAQRLVRRLCPDCRTEGPPSPAEQLFLREQGAPAVKSVWREVGCVHCGSSGFRGRIAIGEAFIAEGEVSAAIARREPLHVLAEKAGAAGLRSLARDGVDKALAGQTSLTEIMAIVET